MACLKAGNLTAAREKFSRCLKPPFDLNQLNLGSRLVQDVVEYLESTVRPVISLVRAKQADCAAMKGKLRNRGPGKRIALNSVTMPVLARGCQCTILPFFPLHIVRLVIRYS